MQDISQGRWGGTGDTPGIADFADPDEYLGGMYPDEPFTDPDEYLGGMYPDEPFSTDADQIFGDITSDTAEDYTPYPDEKWGAPIEYTPYPDEKWEAPLYGFRKPPGSFMFPGNLFSFLDKESYGLMPNAELPYKMYEDEEINPDMLNPDYFNQFQPG